MGVWLSDVPLPGFKTAMLLGSRLTASFKILEQLLTRVAAAKFLGLPMAGLLDAVIADARGGDGVALLAVDAAEDEILPFEYEPQPGKPYRKFIVPSAVLNTRARVTRLE